MNAEEKTKRPLIDPTELADATAHWLSYKRLSGFRAMFSEALLIIPVGEYFIGKGCSVTAEKDCCVLPEFKNRERLAGFVNYDVFAELQDPTTKRDFQAILLETKYLKKGHANYSRIITDFVKLAVPSNADIPYRRWALVALEESGDLPPWLKELLRGNARRLNIKPTEQGNTITHDETTSNDAMRVTVEDEKSSIFNKLKAYQISSLKLSVKRLPGEKSYGSDKVIIFEVAREQ